MEKTKMRELLANFEQAGDEYLRERGWEPVEKLPGYYTETGNHFSVSQDVYRCVRFELEREAAREKSEDAVIAVEIGTAAEFLVIFDSWTEYERGWGSRPDGYTLHLSLDDHKAFVKEFNAKHNSADSAPDDYTRANGTPFPVMVDRQSYIKLYKAKKEGKRGLWGKHGNSIPKDRKDLL